MIHYTFVRSRCSSVGVGSIYGQDAGVAFPARSTAATPVLAPTRLPIQWVPWTKRQGRDADHPFPSSVEIKKSDAMPPKPMFTEYFLDISLGLSLVSGFCIAGVM
jgi:hypothetical protein